MTLKIFQHMILNLKYPTITWDFNFISSNNISILFSRGVVFKTSYLYVNKSIFMNRIEWSKNPHMSIKQYRKHEKSFVSHKYTLCVFIKQTFLFLFISYYNNKTCNYLQLVKVYYWNSFDIFLVTKKHWNAFSWLFYWPFY